ncbi:unnamed protein product, partial [Brenthis ino]
MYTSIIFLFKIIFIYAFIALNINFLSVSGNSRGLRIFQGRDAKRGEFPYVVALSLKSSYPENPIYESFCTGSIVTPIWVLTAAHCIPTIEPLINPPHNTSENITILTPVIQYVSPADDYNWIASNIIRTILHPNFKLSLTIDVNDIALVKVQNTKIKALGKISAIPVGTMYGHKVFSLGLGWMQSESGHIDNVLALNKPLQVYDAIVVNCARRPPMSSVSPSLCLAWNCNKPTLSCPGDSGGPVVHPTGIVGIASASQIRHCNTTDNLVTPLVATPVSPYVDWIAMSVRGI